METLNLFISYSHKDDSLVEEFIKRIKPLEDNGILQVWCDKKIEAGNEFQKDIENNFEKADMICLMISYDFLNSAACKQEKDDALKLMIEKGIKVIPVILKDCLWTEYKDIGKLLAIPTDGKAITSYTDQNEGYLDAVRKIKEVCLSITQMQDLKIKNDFETFLNSTELL
jgi:hypothetical protein